MTCIAVSVLNLHQKYSVGRIVTDVAQENIAHTIIIQQSTSLSPALHRDAIISVENYGIHIQLCM